MKIIQVAVYLLLARLLLADLVAAHDGWGWFTVGADAVIVAFLGIEQLNETRFNCAHPR